MSGVYQPELTCHVGRMIKAEYIRFYNVRKKHFDSIQETIVFVIVRLCWMYARMVSIVRYRSYAFDRTLL